MKDDTVNERLSRALSYFQAGLVEEADRLCRELLEEQPHHPGVLRLLGELAIQRKDSQNAVRYLEQSLEYGGRVPEVEYNLAIAYRRLEKTGKAVECLQRLLSGNPDYLPAYRALAELLEQLNRIAEASDVVQAGLALFRDDPRLDFTAALCERRNGNLEAALERLTRTGSQACDDPLNQRILFERARLHDLLHQYPEAMQAMKAANSMAAETWNRMNPGPNRVLAHVKHELDVIDASWAGRWQPSSVEAGNHSPVFLLGFPRSGTTLLDQILDAHPRIGVLTEKQVINRIHEILSTQGHRLPEDLPALDDDINEQAQTFYRKYAMEMLDTNGSALLTVDKFPLHTIFISLIHRLFPDAKIIFAQRHPLDVVLSCYMNDFSMNSAMANFVGLESTAQFYASTLDLWQRCIKLLPIDYHVVRYESLVDDIEGEARKLFNFLDVEWKPGVLDFHTHAQQRDGRITPSYHQVSQPIYWGARYRWKNYADYLEGVAKELQPYIESLGYKENQGMS